MRALAATLSPLLLAGCLWSPEVARDNYLVESTRDLQQDTATTSMILMSARGLQERTAKIREQEALTLPDCFRLALSHSEVLKIQGESILQADALKRQAIGAILPEIAFHGHFTRDSDVVQFGGVSFTPQERTEHWLTAKQTLFSGKLLPALDLARSTRRIESLRLRSQRNQLFFQVAAAFYEILSLERDTNALKGAWDRSAEQLRVLMVRQKAGEAQRQDVLLTQARRDEVDARLTQTQHDAKRARGRLGYLVGIEPLLQKLRDTYQVKAAPNRTPALIDLALKQRLDLQMAQLEVERARSRKKLAQTDYYPNLSVDFTQWTRAEGGFNEFLDWTVGVNLDLTLFDGGAREARIAQSLSQVRQQELNVQVRKKAIRLEVSDAVLAFASLDRSLSAFESRARTSVELVKQVKVQFDVGEAMNLDVLVANETKLDAERNLGRARYARKLAALRIALVVGEVHHILRDNR